MKAKKVDFTEFETSIPDIMRNSDFIVVLCMKGNELQLHTNLVTTVQNTALMQKVLKITQTNLAQLFN